MVVKVFAIDLVGVCDSCSGHSGVISDHASCPYRPRYLIRGDLDARVQGLVRLKDPLAREPRMASGGG